MSENPPVKTLQGAVIRVTLQVIPGTDHVSKEEQDAAYEARERLVRELMQKSERPRTANVADSDWLAECWKIVRDIYAALPKTPEYETVKFDCIPIIVCASSPDGTTTPTVAVADRHDAQWSMVRSCVFTSKFTSIGPPNEDTLSDLRSIITMHIF